MIFPILTSCLPYLYASVLKMVSVFSFNRIASLLVTLFFVVSFTQANLTTGYAQEETPTAQIYWGAWISDNAKTAPFDYVDENNRGILGTFETRMNKKVSTVHWGLGKQTVTVFPTSVMTKMRNSGRIPFL